MSAEPAGSRRRLWTEVLRPRGPRTDLPVAVLTTALGLGLAASVHIGHGPTGLAAARSDDLVALLADLEGRSARLSAEISDLRDTAQALTDSAGAGVALAQARQRAADLGILAGTIGAQGPGITLEIFDPGHAVNADVLLDAIEELRGAGAEAIELSGVRVVTETSVVDAPGGISVSGRLVSAPYRLRAIGDPATLQKALEIPGGVTDAVAGAGNGASAHISQQAQLQITSLRPTEPAR